MGNQMDTNEMLKEARADVAYCELDVRNAKDKLERRRKEWQEALQDVKVAEQKLKAQRQALFNIIRGR